MLRTNLEICYLSARACWQVFRLILPHFLLQHIYFGEHICITSSLMRWILLAVCQAVLIVCVIADFLNVFMISMELFLTSKIVLKQPFFFYYNNNNKIKSCFHYVIFVFIKY